MAEKETIVTSFPSLVRFASPNGIVYASSVRIRFQQLFGLGFITLLHVVYGARSDRAAGEPKSAAGLMEGFGMAPLDFIGRESYHYRMKAIVSEKGQVTIPKACRDRLGLQAGSVLDFEARDGRLIAVKQQRQDVFLKWRGRAKLPRGRNVDQYLEIIRK